MTPLSSCLTVPSHPPPRAPPLSPHPDPTFPPIAHYPLPHCPTAHCPQVNVYKTFGPTAPVLLGTLIGHSRPVAAYVWTHDDTRIVTIGDDGAAIHWDLHKWVDVGLHCVDMCCLLAPLRASATGELPPVVD
jgi:hypothetical protein